MKIVDRSQGCGYLAERLYAYRAKGLIDQMARGLYRWADAPEVDQDLLETAQRAPRRTLPDHCACPPRANGHDPAAY